MRTILFTLNSTVTPNADKICHHHSGRRYNTPQQFIDTLLQYEVIKNDSEVVIYEVWEYVHTFNNDKTIKSKNVFIGHITVK